MPLWYYSYHPMPLWYYHPMPLWYIVQYPHGPVTKMIRALPILDAFFTNHAPNSCRLSMLGDRSISVPAPHRTPLLHTAPSVCAPFVSFYHHPHSTIGLSTIRVILPTNSHSIIGLSTIREILLPPARIRHQFEQHSQQK